MRMNQQYFTAYDLRPGGTGAPECLAGPSMFRLEKIVDFALTNYLAADTIKMFTVPAGGIVQAVGYRLLVAEGATCTMGFGDSGSATQWITAANLNTTAGTPNASDVLATPIAAKAYAAADYLLCTLNHNMSHAKIAFYIWLRDCGVGFTSSNPRLGSST